MASPISGQPYSFNVSLLSTIDNSILSNPTLAAGDVKISTDGGSLANLSTLPSVTPASGGIVHVSLSTNEVGTNRFSVVFSDQAGNEWHDLYCHETVQSNTPINTGVLVDAVWDEVLSKSTHNVAQSAGKTLRQLTAIATTEGTVTDTGASTTVFDTNLASTTGDFYRDQLLVFDSGPLVGQARPIQAYSISGQVTLDEALTNAPSSGDTFVIYAYHIHSTRSMSDAVWNEALSGHTTSGTAGAALSTASGLSVGGGDATLAKQNEILALVSGIDTIGSGAISHTITVTDTDSNPLDGVEVWISTDSAGTNVVAGTRSTDALGQVTFMLDAGSYYAWQQLSGYNFTNPTSFTVS